MTEKQITGHNPIVRTAGTELDPADFEHKLEYQLALVQSKLDASRAQRDILWANIPMGTFAPPAAVREADYVQHLEDELRILERKIERRDRWALRRRQLGEITRSFYE